MAEIDNEKVASSNTDGADTPSDYATNGAPVEAPPTVRGKPWMYRKIKLGPITLPHYASPTFQVGFVAMVCFLCPGMFNAVNGLGAGGLVSAHDINHANTALYSTFSVVGFFCGSIANRIGLRLTLGIGGFGYFLYICSILSYNHNGNAGFLIFAGALLGFCAAMLWTAQGAIMMGYPSERSKGKYIAWFWMIFNLGGVIGALVPLGQNLHSTGNSVSDGTYIAFIILMACGFFLAAFLCNPAFVEREDGSHVIVMKHPSWKSEILGLFSVLKTDWYIVLLFPMFLASNWFYTYHFQDVNLAKFNIRTRALNNVLYWTAQIVGACIFGYALDTKSICRPLKAKINLVVLLVLTMAIWGGGYAWQKTYTRAEVSDKNYVKLDFKDSGYIGPMFLYIFYGMYDAAWQTSVYWFMGSLTNNTRKLANFTGFYKGIQSAGGAIAPAIDSAYTAYMTEFGANWGLLAGSLIIAAPVIFTKIQETVPLEQDLKFSDETYAEVAPSDVRRTSAGPEITSEKI